MTEPKDPPKPISISQAPVSLPNTDQYDPRGSIPNTVFTVALIAALLGAILGSSASLTSKPMLDLIAGNWARPQLGLYIAAMAVFHLMEFFTTAGWNPQKLSVDAYLLNNGKQYHIAHAIGLTEYFISSMFFPRKFNSSWSSFPVLFLVTSLMIGAQVIRSLAMIQAAQSFSHIVKNKKYDDHVLVTHGVYSWSRHPSYAGFFYWAVLTQILLGNIVSTVGFVIVLAKFFNSRIADEERWLVNFFGSDYVEYRRRVGTKLPFYFCR
ncbi:uncharacterized protein L203_106068 [Cryptococcus depauperatus CBS 7841]|uniref:Protein-S-isoprenylcysteine O-methyltransferase n=1 Tax=Cryptococcus depauperatus CBS 7841 TaxID=1295531 RepID=A0A1E3IVB3_9TREE|nr:protein-S-isoprenylcysteine O-methyltransferase [Cryptococcus depauperatus CBS 7841]